MKGYWIDKKWVKVAIHVLAWIIVLSLPYLLRPHYENSRKDPDATHFFILNSFTGFLWIAVFYLNAYSLTPAFIYRKEYLKYTLLIAGIFCVTMIIHLFLFSILIQTWPLSILGSIGFNLPTFLLTVAVSITYKFLIDKAKNDKITQEKHEQNLKTEVSFLRSQISPHFIFNVLNNMVALVRMKSDELEPTIMKLSSLMQYMLYETDEEKVPLKNEIEYLQNYIDLQKQRFGSKIKMNISLHVPDESYQIEPMLLIPFVENAFKHGVGLIENPQIDIELYQKKNKVYFNTRNKYNGLKNEIKDKISGIGLSNVTRRLNLLYPNRHSLLINKDGSHFNVSLQLMLN